MFKEVRKKVYVLHARLHAGTLGKLPKNGEAGQDFAEYALILGAVAAVALVVLSPFKAQLLAAFNSAISALAAARG